ncbi:unnamed protein product [Rhizophagus irregularis]|nr:unnamed protein product [Rhizophagus irregularis]
METIRPNVIIEWIPYNNLENIKYLTKGGFSEIYTAKWIDGRYEKWDSKVQQLVRIGTHNVILKELKNVENASQSWFEEAKSHLTLKQQKAFYISRSNDFTISSNASNLSKSSNQYIPISSNDDDIDVQNDYEREFMQRRSNIGTNDEVQNNPSLHSEQDKSEILDGES